MTIAPGPAIGFSAFAGRAGSSVLLAPDLVGPVASLRSETTSIRPVLPATFPLSGFDRPGLALDLDSRIEPISDVPLRFGVFMIRPGPDATEPPRPDDLDKGTTAQPPVMMSPPPVVLPSIPMVAMAGAKLTRMGEVVREFAFADRDKSQITVRIGEEPLRVIGNHDDGVRNPSALRLDDLNGDQIKDLIVANSGANNILIYLGQGSGRFAPELNGGRGIAVGLGPAGITVDDINDDGIPDLVIANRDSDDVSLLMGQGRLADWSLTDGGRLGAGTAPVFTAIGDVDEDGIVDILVCNTGSNNISVIRGLGDGRFDEARAKVMAVGDGPIQMFLGRFDHHMGPGLLTVNSRSSDLTLISDIMGPDPQSQTIASGGLTPTAAVAADVDSDGLTDLIVANTGDGKLALFQGGEDGLTLTKIVTSIEVPAPTSLLVGNQSPEGFDVYAANAGSDAASILHFDLSIPGDYGEAFPTLPALTQGDTSGEDALSAHLISQGDSAFNLVGMLGFAARWGDSSDTGDEGGVGRDAATGRIAGSRPRAQSLDDEEEAIATKPDPDFGRLGRPESSDEDEPSTWAGFVLGLEAALDEARAVAGREIASRTFLDDEMGPGSSSLANLAWSGEATRTEIEDSAAVDEAIGSLWPEGWADPSTDPARDGEGEEPSDPRTPGRVETLPTISLGLIFAHQLLVRVAPPRRPRARRSPAGPAKAIR